MYFSFCTCLLTFNEITPMHMCLRISTQVFFDNNGEEELNNLKM